MLLPDRPLSSLESQRVMSLQLNHSVAILVVCCACLCLLNPAQAQVTQTYTSLEALVAEAEDVVRGPIVKVSRDVKVPKDGKAADGKEWSAGLVEYTFTVRIDETLRGKKAGEVELVRTTSAYDMRYTQWCDAKTEFLWFLGQRGKYSNVTDRDMDRNWGALRLGDPVASERDYGSHTPPIFAMDFRVLTSREDILTAARNVAASIARSTRKRIEFATIDLPADVAVRCRATSAREFFKVPVVDELEPIARKMITAPHELIRGFVPHELSQKMLRLGGVEFLGHFKSDDNAALLKGLLDDPFYFVSYEDAHEKPLKQPVRQYVTRAAAYQILRRWKVAVPKPILQEPHIRDSDAIKSSVAETAAVDRYGDALPEGVFRRFGSLRFRHAGGYKSISDLTFSPDGKRIASVGPDHTVRVWDLDGRELNRLVGEENEEFTSVAFSTNGARLAACGNRELRVWDVASGDMLMHVRGARGGAPVFSSDGKRVAATQLYFTPMGGYLKRLFGVWDVATGKLLHSLDSSKDQLWPLAIALDRELTASRDEKGIRIRRLDTGETVCTYTRHAAGVSTVAFTRDGTLAASSCLHEGVLEIHVWDPVTSETTRRYKTKTSFAACQITFSPDGQTLLGAASVRDFDGGYADGKLAVDSPARVELFDVKTGRLRHHIEGFTAPALSPDGKTLAAARFDRIQLFDASTGKPLTEYAGHDAPLQTVAFSRDGKRVASVGRDHTIRYWDAATGDLLSRRHVTGGIGDASFSGDLTRVAVLQGELERNGRRRITVWDDASDKPPFDLAMPDGDRLVALSADGQTLATWGKDDLRVWNLASGGEPLKIASPEPPIGICGFALSDDGSRVIAAEMGEPLGIWDTRTGALIHSLKPRAERKPGSVGGPFAISPGGRTLATHAYDTIVLFELETGDRITTLPRQTTGYVAEFAFSPDGKLLASSARDGGIRLLAVSTGKILADFQTHAPGWTSIAFSPDGKKLLSGGGAAVLELRDISQFHRAAQSAVAEAAASQAELAKVETPRSVPPLGKTDPQPTGFEPLLQRIDDAREAGKLVKSSVAGGNGGGPFESTLGEPTLLVGFDYTLSTFYGGHLTVKSVRPIYMTREGETRGAWHGVPHGKVHRVRAKAGYVATAIVAKHGHRLDGLRLIYMRVTDGRINPDDTYRSKWIGGHGGGRETLFGTYGDPIVSIFGRQGHDLDAIGFVQLDEE